MEDKTAKTPPQRVRRPDTAALPDTPDIETPDTDGEAESEGAPIAPEEVMGTTTDKVTVSTEVPMTASGPFVPRGVVVLDAAGRQVCMVASSHATLEARAATAKWIADKLNA